MPEPFAAQTLQSPNSERDYSRYGGAKADSILARADRREPLPVAALQGVSLDKMDKIAALVAAIMTIGPLFAAFVGRMHS